MSFNIFNNSLGRWKFSETYTFRNIDILRPNQAELRKLCNYRPSCRNQTYALCDAGALLCHCVIKLSGQELNSEQQVHVYIYRRMMSYEKIRVVISLDVILGYIFAFLAILSKRSGDHNPLRLSF